jgi:hypothetical protein
VFVGQNGGDAKLVRLPPTRTLHLLVLLESVDSISGDGQ